MWARSARSPKSYSADKPYSCETHRNGRLACHRESFCILCILCTSAHWLCFAKTLDSYLLRRRRINGAAIRWVCSAKIVTDIFTWRRLRRLNRGNWLCFAKFVDCPPASRKHTLLITVEPLELRQRGPVTGILGVSGAKISCVLQVALGDAYPRQIDLRSRDI